MAFGIKLPSFVGAAKKVTAPRPAVKPVSYQTPAAPSYAAAPAYTPAPYAGPASIAPPGLNPEELQYFQSARNRIDDTYGMGVSQNKYGQDTAKLGYDQQYADLVKRFTQLRNQIPGGLARRGMLNSGIAAGQYQQFGTDRTDAYARALQNYQNTVGGLQLERDQLEKVRTSTLADLEAQETARRNAIAAALRAAG